MISTTVSSYMVSSLTEVTTDRDYQPIPVKGRPARATNYCLNIQIKFKSDVVMCCHKECVSMSYWLWKLNRPTTTHHVLIMGDFNFLEIDYASDNVACSDTAPPALFLSSCVVSIFNKGDRANRANYRPVLLTSVPCKIMESIIKEKLMAFLDTNDLLSKEQHGFRSGRSCLTNLLETLENWTKALDEGYGLDVVHLDYRKAFDSVPYRRLIEKLKSFGINGKLLQ